MVNSKRRNLINTAIILAVIAALIYIIARVALFLSAEYSSIEKFFAVLLIVGEFFVLMHSVGYTVNLLKVLSLRKKEYEDKELVPSVLSGQPSVAVLVAARHEPAEVLRATFSAINAVSYKNKEVFFLDDSSQEKYKKEADDLAGELNLKLFRRQERHGAKAGIINDCLKTLDHKYAVLFDADQNPLPKFLDSLVSLMEKDDKLAFIQTPQFYSNIEESRVARASTLQQSVFYEYICEGKGINDAMFCCGTNVIFNLKALKEVGGLDESSVTEDFATSVKLHIKGWKSLYYPHTYTFGMGPENLGEYFKQQFRWAAGTIKMFRKLMVEFLKAPFALTLFQWWEYFLSSSYYFIGGIFFILMICPIAYILFKVPSFFARPEIYFLAFIPYITFSISVFYMGLGLRNYKIGDLFSGQLLGIVTFPVYIRAAFSALTGRKAVFEITSKERKQALSLTYLFPQIAMLLLNFAAVVWAVNRFFYERNPALIVNGFWAFYHFLALSAVFYFNETEPGRIRSKRLNPKFSFSYNPVNVQNLHGLDKTTWRINFTVLLSEYIGPGTQLMCKIRKGDNKSIIFDGIVLWSAQKRSYKGFETTIGLLTASQLTREELKGVIK